MHSERATGEPTNQPGFIAGIAIAAVVFVLLNLIMFAAIACYIHSRSKNGRSTHTVYENHYSSDGDLQTEYHQVERPQSYELPFDPKHSTHPGNQSITMSQESDRQQFLKRTVRRPFLKFFKWNHNLTTISPYVGMRFYMHRSCFSIARGTTVCSRSACFLQYSETHAYSVIDEEVETNLSHEVVWAVWVLLIVWFTITTSVFLPNMIKTLYQYFYSLQTESIFFQSKWCGS